MSLAPFVRTLGRGPGRSRSLTQGEAHEAMTIMLSGDADREALGALLMLLRMKGETAEEIAGFADAARASIGQLPAVDLDWSSYAAGRTRGLPWFLLSAKLVARAGYRILLHGWNGPDAAVREGLAHADIGVAHSADETGLLLDQNGIAYLPLERLSPELFDLLNLRDVFGLRSCINTVSRMLNPGGAQSSVQGVFHPSYRLLQADAAQLLGWSALTVIKGGGGEFERHPGKDIAGFGLRAGETWQGVLPSSITETRRLSDGLTNPAALSALWDGTLKDRFAEEIVLGTAEAAFNTLGVENASEFTRTLWSERNRSLAA